MIQTRSEGVDSGTIEIKTWTFMPEGAMVTTEVLKDNQLFPVVSDQVTVMVISDQVMVMVILGQVMVVVISDQVMVMVILGHVMVMVSDQVMARVDNNNKERSLVLGWIK